MNYYDEIKTNLISNEAYKKIKDYSKNRSDIDTYYKVGKLLAEAGKYYGEGIIREYSIKLTNELGKGYTFTSLTRMKKFYFLIQKVATLSQQLTYGHYIELLPIKDINEIKYYIKIIENYNLSIRQLRFKIKSNEYKRLSEGTRNKLLEEEKTEVEDFIKKPIFIKSSNVNTEISEKILKQLILEDIGNFLLELGNCFSYIGNEYRIKIGNRYNYLDFLLFNYEYNCFVVVELKVTELKKEHIGQIQLYMNYIDKNLKSINQNKTIGIICKHDNEFVMEYCSYRRTFITLYVVN
ncbi:MAG: PDDEXK nuclease domain-containing protein [Bacilli bacterium]